MNRATVSSSERRNSLDDRQRRQVKIMSVHLAQVAAVQGSVLFLWDLDEKSSVCASLAIIGDLDPRPGQVVRVRYEGERPVAAEQASERELTSAQAAALLPGEPVTESDPLLEAMSAGD